MRWICDKCEKRPALLFRRSHKYRGRKSNLIIKSDSKHTLCRQCWAGMYESMRQPPPKVEIE